MIAIRACRLALVLAALLAAPLAGGSAAHPHPHRYVGAAWAGEAGLEAPPVHAGGGLDGRPPACGDTPRLASLVPPQPVDDRDPELGVGGACFAFLTVYGDDTGTTLRVRVLDGSLANGIAWLACVDFDGDGLCRHGRAPDASSLCATSGNQSVSLLPPAPTCTIFAIPGAADPTVYVIFLGEAYVDLGSGGIVRSEPATQGYVVVS